MKIRKRQRMLRQIALGLAVAAVAAPGAQAMPLDRDGAADATPAASEHQVYGVGATPRDWIEYTAQTDSQIVERPAPAFRTGQDTRDIVGATEPIVQVYGVGATPRDWVEYTAQADNPIVERPAPAFRTSQEPSNPAIVAEPTGFDWTDAGIGAGFALGIALLAAGTALVARRHQKASVAL
jgi:hypothetical protein